MDTGVIQWRRFWARHFDLLTHATLIGLLWALIDEESLMAIDDTVLSFLMLFVWTLLDGVYMTYFGTTLGKKLMGIRVLTLDGQRISRHDAFRRARLVWLRGMGLGLGIVQLIANIVAYNKLNKEGISTWDRDLKLQVAHRKIGVLRLLVCPAVVLAAVAAFVYDVTTRF